MRQGLIFLAGFGIALAVAKFLLVILVGLVTGAVSIFVQALWPSPQRPFIDPINRPKPITRKAQLWGAGGLALFGVAVLVGTIMTPLGAVSIFRFLAFFIAGYALGASLAIVPTERQTREAHNRWVASMSPQSHSEYEA